MRVEVIKIKDVEIRGSKATVISKDDFTRLISSYGLNMRDLKAIGISRSLWSNTLKFYGFDRNDLQKMRNTIINHDKLHLNSNRGYMVEVEKLSAFGKISNNKTKDNLKELDIIKPGISSIWYSHINDDPSLLTKELSLISMRLIYYKDLLKNLQGRARKVCRKRDVKIYKLFSSTLEFKVAGILTSLGLKFEHQFYIKPYWYDFKVGNKLFEIDGAKHNLRFDQAKNIMAEENGYNVIRLIVDKKGINKSNYESYKDKISKAFR